MSGTPTVVGGCVGDLAMSVLARVERCAYARLPGRGPTATASAPSHGFGWGSAPVAARKPSGDDSSPTSRSIQAWL